MQTGAASMQREGARPDTVFYVLVRNATEGMALYDFLRSAGCRARIAPAPRGETTCCGMALRVAACDIAAVRCALAAEDAPGFDRVVELADDIDPHRDVYC